MKTQKNKLMTSVIAIFLCFAMLVGTTYAWFTDSVSSDGNIIQTGNLKVDLSHKVGDTWVSLKQDPDHKIFDYDKWEPGYTRVETIKVQNVGSLALTYRLTMDVLTATATLGPNGESLADVIDVYFVSGDSSATSFEEIKNSADWTYKGTLSEVMGNAAAILTGELLPEGEILAAGMPASTKVGEEAITIALHMQEDAGNEYQDLSVGEINLNLVATQLGYEEDSFGAEYDVIAKDYIIEDQTALDAALKAKKSLIILAPGEYKIPAKVSNKTVTYSGTHILGLDGAKISAVDNISMTDVTIENVEFTCSIRPTFKGNSVIKNSVFTAGEENAIRNAKVATGATLTIENCVFNLNDLFEDGTSDAGAIHFSGNENGTIILDGCTVNNGYVSFGRTMNVELKNTTFNGTNIGAYGDTTLTGCTFSPDTTLYINPYTGNTSVEITVNNCQVIGGAPVASVFVDRSANFVYVTDWQVVIDGVVIDENTVLTSQSIVAGEDGANFNLSFKGQAIASLSIPKDAIADLTKPVTVTFVSIDPAETITLGENIRSYAYDINVTNLKSNPADRAPITVVLTVPNALAAANVYHNGELIENYTYNEVSGSVTFETTSFSPYAVSYTEYEVSTIEQLREYASKDNVNIKLVADLYVNLDPNAAVNNCDDKHFCKLTGSYEYYNCVNINGKNVAIDLNGHSIIVSGDKNADTVGAVFFIMPNSNLNISDSVGGGKIKLCDPAYIVWAPYDAEYGLSYVDVYGGIFMSHGYAGDERTPGRFAMFYAGEGGLIDIYGGYFLYENDDYTDKNGVVHPNNNNGFCNVMNSAATPCITIHDGAMLINQYYRQDGYVNNVNNWQADHDSIFLAQNTELVETAKSVTIDSVTYNTWYQVKCNHTGGKATCTTLATCDYCGKAYGNVDSTNHTGGTATCQSGAKCSRCGVVYTGKNSSNHVLNADTAPWKSSEATCDKYCSCGEMVFTAFHTWNNNGNCTRCGRDNNLIGLVRTTFASGTYTNIPVKINSSNPGAYIVLLYKGTGYNTANALENLVMYYQGGVASGFKTNGGTGVTIMDPAAAKSLPIGTYTIRVWNAASQVVDCQVIELIDSEEVFVYTARDLYNIWKNPAVPNGGWGFDAQLLTENGKEFIRLTTNAGAGKNGAVGAGRLFISFKDGVQYTYSGKSALLGIKYRGYSGGAVNVMCGDNFGYWSSGGVRNTFYTGHSADWVCSTSWSYEVPKSYGTFSLDFYTGKGAGYTLDIMYVSISYCGGGLGNAVDRVYG